MRSSGLLLLLVGSLASPACAVKREDFKTCAQSGFCRRLRDLPVSSTSSPYTIDASSARFDSSSGAYSAVLRSSIYPEASFSLQISVTTHGTARIKVDEINGLRQRYNETASWALLQEPSISTATAFKTDKNGKSATLSWQTHNGMKYDAKITYDPLKIELAREGQAHVVFNEQNLFHMEHFRVKKIGTDHQDPPQTVIDDSVVKARAVYESHMSEDGGWEETFGQNTDSKPKGPEALSFDVSFPGYDHVYGLPQHASPLSLRTTRGGDGAFTDPYRMYNADVFEYEADSEMSIYGSIPFMHAHKAGSTVAVFDVVASETWVDITKSGKGTHTHWMSESGILDLFIFLGPTSEDIFSSYSLLTGTTALPQMFAIGHHQCRWNYLNQEDVAEVTRKFDEHDIPFDVIWLDIEYATEHKYFIWDRSHFPEPEKMQDALAAVGRQLVAIVDPHIKRVDDLYVYKEAKDLDILCKQADGKSEFEGWCWTGSSAWVDWLHPASWGWWKGLFAFDKFQGSKANLFIWNDMNEPAVFSGPEISMPRDNIHHGGWEHRDIHNIFGMLYHNITSQALVARQQPSRRPFVLSRSFFAGSQRFGAIWTGDNMGTWEHLAGSVPMILSNSVAGMAFNGADVGGFFGNPEPEMLVRWYQNGAFHPFFRAHAHIDTKRREPYLYDEPIRGYLRDAIRLRYSLLPAWYTAFFHASLSGTPIIRPHYMMFPDDKDGFGIDNQFFVGNSGLMVHPVTSKGADSATVHFGDDQPYYDYLTHEIHMGTKGGSGAFTSVAAPLSKVPLFHRGGTILTRRDIVRRAATLMWKDPITLVIALDRSGSKADGDLYLDDGDSYGYQSGQMVWRNFKLAVDDAGYTLASNDAVKAYKGPNTAFTSVAATYSQNNAFAKKIADVVIDDIIVMGLKSRPRCITALGSSIAFDWTDGLSSNAGKRKSGGKASVLRIGAASLPVVKDWNLRIVLDGDKSCEQPQALVQSRLREDKSCPLPGYARCDNKGHSSQCILLSRVNDGICDPECCDGSDETDGKVHCPNRCAAVAKEYKAKADEEARIQRVGAKIRSDWSTFGLREKRKFEKSIVALEQDIVGLKQRERALKVTLDRVEATEAAEIQRKKNTKLFARLEEHKASIINLRKHRSHLQKQLEELQTLMSDLKTSFNPNYQDMAVLGAVRAFDDWRRKFGHPILEESPVARGEDAEAAPIESTAATTHLEFQNFSDDMLRTLEEEDSLSLISELDAPGSAAEAASLLFRLEEYLPDSLRHHYDFLRRTLLDTLTSVGILSKAIVEKSERPDIVRARSAYQQAERSLRDSESKLQDAQASLKKDWGADWAWKKLDGECIEKDTGEYVYELCFFDRASQRSTKGHGTTTLGRFSSWDTTSGVDSPQTYLTQHYTAGERCWNGPDRSVEVEFSCGTSNVLLSIMEPEKCTYLFKVQTPGVCAAAASNMAATHGDEL